MSMTKPMKTTHTPTPEHHKTPLSASEKHRAKFIQLGFTCDLNNKKKSVFLFQKLNYYTTALGMWSDHWHFIYKKIKAGRTPQLSVFVHDSLYGKNFISAKCCEDLWKLLELLSKMTLDFKWSLFHLNNTVVLLQLTRNSLQSYNTVTSFL